MIRRRTDDLHLAHPGSSNRFDDGMEVLHGLASSLFLPLLARLGDGMPRNNAELLVTIFVKAGADPEPLRPFLVVDRSPEERRNFDRLVSRARSNPECRP